MACGRWMCPRAAYDTTGRSSGGVSKASSTARSLGEVLAPLTNTWAVNSRMSRSGSYPSCKASVSSPCRPRIASAYAQVRLALLGDGHDLGKDGVEVLVAWMPVQDLAQMPVGGVEQSAHAFMRPSGSEA